MSDIGYVRIYRSLLGHPAFRNDAEALAFAWMVVRAQWRDTRVRYKERAISLRRGQLAVSVRDMAAALDRDKAWIERLWKRLKSETMIETVSETGVSIVTICNYDDFQGGDESRETPAETPRKTGARQGRDTEQRREKGKKEEPSGSSTPIAPSTSPKPVAVGAFACPSWASAQVWADLLVNRKAKRLPNTATAYAKFTADLMKLADDEWPPGRLLEAIVARGWGGVYDPRGTQNGSRSTTDRRGAAGPDRRTNLASAIDDFGGFSRG